MNKINVSDFYQNYPNKEKVKYSLFIKIFKTYLKLYASAIAEGYALTFLNRLGGFKMIKCWRNMEILNIDWGETLKERKIRNDPKYLSYRTNFYYFVLEWNKTSGYSFDFKDHFFFKAFPNFNEKIPNNTDKLNIATLNRKSRGSKS